MVNGLLALAGTVVALAYLSGTRRSDATPLLLCLFECILALAGVCLSLEYG